MVGTAQMWMNVSKKLTSVMKMPCVTIPLVFMTVLVMTAFSEPVGSAPIQTNVLKETRLLWSKTSQITFMGIMTVTRKHSVWILLEDTTVLVTTVSSKFCSKLNLLNILFEFFHQDCFFRGLTSNVLFWLRFCKFWSFRVKSGFLVYILPIFSLAYFVRFWISRITE